MNKKSFLLLILCLLFFTLTSCGKQHTHNYGEWNIIKEATCLEVGVKQRNCDCGAIETDYISKLLHNEVIDEAVLPTCLTDGLSYGKHCSLCNSVLEEQTTISAVGHSYSDEWEYVDENTCGRLCLRCGEYDLCSHTSSGEATQDQSEICLVCGYIIQPMLSHTTHTNSNEWGFNSTHHWYKCDGCEAQKYEFTEHNLSKYEIELNATSTSEGVMTATCLDGCGYVSVKKILKTPVLVSDDDLSFSWNKVENATGYYLYNKNAFVADLGDVLTYTTPVSIGVFEYSIAAYTTDSTYYEISNLSTPVKIGFEADIENMQEDYGTDFDGYNPIDNSSFFVPVGKTLKSGWKTDNNGVKAFAIQANYQGVSLALDPSDSTNTVLRVQGSKEVTRVALNANPEIVEIGSYKISLKVKLGTEDSTSIGKILLRVNERSDISASGAITDSIFLSESDDSDSFLSTNEWTTLEAIFTVTDELYENIFYQEVCFAFIVYTYNDTNGLTSSVNHILIDDLEVYKVNSFDPDHEHTYVWNELKEASCKEVGLKPHYSCDGCDKYFDENKMQIPYKTLVIEKLQHNYEYNVIKAATTTQEGIAERVCLGACKEVKTVQILKQPVVEFVSNHLIWNEVDNADGYRLYINDEYVSDLGNISEYMPELVLGSTLYQIEAYTNNENYCDLGSMSEALGLTVREQEENLQDGYGTDFDGYNPTDHAAVFKPVGETIKTSGWKTDGNGVKAIGIQGGYQAVALQLDPDDSTNPVLRVQGGKVTTRVALNLNSKIINSGTYKASVKVRLGTENATDIGAILFRFNELSDISASGALSSSIYFSRDEDTDSLLSASEWTTLEVVFVVTEELSAKLSIQDVCLVFIVYTNNDTNGLGSSNNHILIDDFEITKVKVVDTNHQHKYAWKDTTQPTLENAGLKAHYYCEDCYTYFDEAKNEIDLKELIVYLNLQDGYGTDFDGYNPTDHAGLYKPVGTTLEKSGWKTDANGVKAIGIQGGYQLVALQLDPSDSTNTVLRVQGGKVTTRVALNLNPEIINPGTYKASVKIRLGSENSTDIGAVLFRFNELSDITASGAISSSIYFSRDKDTDSLLSASEWTTLEVEFTVTEDLSVKLSAQDVCLVFIVYTYNDTNGLGSSNNHILIDDFEIYKIN